MASCTDPILSRLDGGLYCGKLKDAPFGVAGVACSRRVIGGLHCGRCAGQSTAGSYLGNAPVSLTTGSIAATPSPASISRES
jgi:hypothetical protein